MATEVGDTTAWIDHLASQVTLVGWSYGATIAIEVTAGDERVTSLVAYEPVLGPFGHNVLAALHEADLDRRVEIINLDVSLFPGSVSTPSGRPRPGGCCVASPSRCLRS